MRRFIDTVMDKSKIIPSPDKYTGHKTHFNDMTKKTKIYMFDRKV